MDTFEPKVARLTRRERDCLRLIGNGLTTTSAAAQLGVSCSTLNKHLASVRQKLGVRRTMQALLLVQAQGEAFRPEESGCDNASGRDASQSSALCDFANAVASCGRLDSAWAKLCSHIAGYGLSYVNFGVVAEPAGQLTNGSRLLKSTMPRELLEIYRDDDSSNSIVVGHIIANRRETLLDGQAVLRAQMPNASRALQSLHDTYACQVLCMPDRDRATGAPYAIVFTLGREAVPRSHCAQREIIATLKATRDIFWGAVQTQRLLSDCVNLTRRQRDALTYAARGFTAHETAEHLGISIRAVEKNLGGARQRLGARTTVSALYRAMVYRAL